MRTLTVKELIKLLEEIEPDMLVSLEGCDCEGDATGVEIQDYDPHAEPYLLIKSF